MRAPIWLATILCLGCGPGPQVYSAEGPGDGGTRAGGDGGASSGADAFFSVRDAAAVEAVSCHRTVSLQAVTISRPVPFDVVIVADNSDSISWSRASLSSGLADLLSRVRGHEARFFVLTTTQYGASSAAAVSPVTGTSQVVWQDSVTQAPYANAMTQYAQTCTDPKGAVIACPKYPANTDFTLEGKWEFRLPPPVGAITAAMTDAELATQQKKIADAVLALGGGGAQQEQPVCTLSRYLAQKPELLPKNVVFMVLTDEDDTSPPSACLDTFEVTEMASASLVPCTSMCTWWDYSAERAAVQEVASFTCVPVDDKGTAHPEKGVDDTLVTNYTATCAGTTVVDCTPAALAKIADQRCGAGHVIDKCKLRCGPVQGTTYCQVERMDAGVNLCTQAFDFAGQHFANLADYCTKTFGPGWGACTVQGYRPGPLGQQWSGSEHATPLVPGTSTTDMIAAFRTNADRLFGPGNYAVAPIVLDPSFSCPLQPGQSYATNLRQLATSPQDVFPLCQDYAPALERIATFASELVQNDFPLALDAYEAVDAVVVTGPGGAQRTLAPGDFRYDRAAKMLRINPGALGPRDASLSVSVDRHCEPIP